MAGRTHGSSMGLQPNPFRPKPVWDSTTRVATACLCPTPLRAEPGLHKGLISSWCPLLTSSERWQLSPMHPAPRVLRVPHPQPMADRKTSIQRGLQLQDSRTMLGRSHQSHGHRAKLGSFPRGQDVVEGGQTGYSMGGCRAGVSAGGGGHPCSIPTASSGPAPSSGASWRASASG